MEAGCLVVSGLINPVFIVTAFLEPSGVYARRVPVLRIMVVIMIPFCWIFFATSRFDVYPRGGHFLWIIGMLIVLFSGQLAGITTHKEKV